MGSAWRITAASGLILVSVAAVLGDGAQSAVRALEAIFLIATTVIQLRRRPDIAPAPWVLLAIGGLLALASAATRLIHGLVIDEASPFPSFAEFPGYVGYMFVIAAARSFWRHRTTRSDVAAALDGFLVASAAAVVVFSAVLSDYLRDESISVTHRLGNVGYTVLTLVLLGHVARLAVGPGVRNTSWRLIAVATTAILANDLFLLLDSTGSTWAATLAGITSPIAFVMAGSALLHPEAAALTAAPVTSPPQLSRGRLAMLGTALLTLPAALLFSLVRGTDPDLPVLVGGSVALATLSLARITLLFRANERAAQLETAVADVGRQLLEGHDTNDLANAIVEAIELVVDDARFAVTVDGGSANRWLIQRDQHHGPIEFVALDEGVDPNLRELVGIWRDDETLVEVQLGEHGRFGSILAVSAEIENPHSLGLQTVAAQITQALATLTLAEARFTQRAEQRLHALVEQSSDLVTVLDTDGKMIFVSPNAHRVLGSPPHQLIGTSASALVHADDDRAARGLLRSPTKPFETPRATEIRLATTDGEYRWFDTTARDFRDDPEVGGVVVTARDITEERAAKLGLLRSEQWFRGLVQNSSDVIAVLDEAGVFTYASPAVTDLTGLEPRALRGRNFLELLPRDDLDSLDQLRRALRSASPNLRRLEIAIERPDMTRRTAEVTVTDLRNDPSVSGLVLNIRDVTDRKLLEEDLRHQVLHDDLTGLGSRVQFSNQLQAALAAPRDGSIVAALFIDIDDFKTINDSLGHAAGDQVLVDISGRLRSKLRLHDNAARFGGDEFAVILTEVYGESDVTLVADRIVEELSQPVMLMGQEIRLGVSVGIAIDDDGTRSPEDLLRAADVAMYEAKAQGKGRWAMFEDSMADQTMERFEINNSLGNAIENDELMVYYQPIVDLGSGRTVGVEALVRWNHPARGMISPGQFVPIAERNGLIAPLGRWVLERATAQVAEWRGRGHDIYASVNVSAVQLQNDGIVHEILEVVDGAGIDRHAVVLELTESALINDFNLVIRRIDALREAGLRVAIDDFGTGYATLTYADRFAADILKIDQSFVARLEDNDDSPIVDTVLNIAKAMGADAVAEGIEVPDQHTRLLAMGCSLGQGYYFTRPAPAEAIAQALTRELDGEALIGHGF
ncbi:MAG: EAL domain-containing protein [Actinomycetota bacterium]